MGKYENDTQDIWRKINEFAATKSFEAFFVGT